MRSVTTFNQDCTTTKVCYDSTGAAISCPTTALRQSAPPSISCSQANGGTPSDLILADILTELQKPQYDIETATCNDGTDDWLMVLDKNVLVAGVPAITYQNLTTGATASVRPPGLTCATPPIPTCPTLPGRGVQTSW